MAHTLNQHTELNPLQISLLRLFDRPMPETEVLALKRLLINHFSGSLEKEITKVIEDKGYTKEHLDNLLNASS
ncbi:hypothetical protein ABIB40_000594 [Pedobacter sp. UYP30]|uniref:hypothetical protein n=1 Tax=Pedobacter sp. UYP30 TaxID=1756400 RepID=UPI003398BDA5